MERIMHPIYSENILLLHSRKGLRSFKGRGNNLIKIISTTDRFYDLAIHQDVETHVLSHVLPDYVKSRKGLLSHLMAKNRLSNLTQDQLNKWLDKECLFSTLK